MKFFFTLRFGGTICCSTRSTRWVRSCGACACSMGRGREDFREAGHQTSAGVSTTHNLTAKFRLTMGAIFPAEGPPFFASLKHLNLNELNKRRLEGCITVDETTQAIRSICPGKSAGPDGIPAEVYKAHEKIDVPILTDQFTHSWQAFCIDIGPSIALATRLHPRASRFVAPMKVALQLHPHRVGFAKVDDGVAACLFLHLRYSTRHFYPCSGPIPLTALPMYTAMPPIALALKDAAPNMRSRARIAASTRIFQHASAALAKPNACPATLAATALSSRCADLATLVRPRWSCVLALVLLLRVGSTWSSKPMTSNARLPKRAVLLDSWFGHEDLTGSVLA
eukprot:scaffold27044_cov32-Tisochrysis_lutea.AAC.2